MGTLLMLIVGFLMGYLNATLSTIAVAHGSKEI